MPPAIRRWSTVGLALLLTGCLSNSPRPDRFPGEPNDPGRYDLEYDVLALLLDLLIAKQISLHGSRPIGLDDAPKSVRSVPVHAP